MPILDPYGKPYPEEPNPAADAKSKALQDSLDQHAKSVASKQVADDHEQEPQPLPTEQTVPSLHPAIAAYYEAEQRDRAGKNKWERIKQWLEVIGFCVGVALGVLTLLNLRTANKQVAIMQRQLEATDRPWIEITKMGVREFRFIKRVDNGKPMLYVDLEMLVTNVGRSVATNVRVSSDMIFQMGIEPEMDLKQDRVCNTTDQMLVTKPFTLFPGRDSGDEFQGKIAYTKAIGGNDTILPPEFGEPRVSPAIIGCVLYDIPGGQSNPHRTQFAYEFVFALPNGKHQGRAFLVGETVPTTNLVLKNDWLGFNNAN